MVIWIVDDDEYNRKRHVDEFHERLPKAIIRTFECLYDASQSVIKNVPDFIFIDLSAVDGCTLPCFDNHSYIGNLQQFVERFRSSFIIIVSAIVSHAEEDIKDLRITCGDNHLFALDPCKQYALVNFCLPYEK